MEEWKKLVDAAAVAVVAVFADAAVAAVELWDSYVFVSRGLGPHWAAVGVQWFRPSRIPAIVVDCWLLGGVRFLHEVRFTVLATV